MKQSWTQPGEIQETGHWTTSTVEIAAIQALDFAALHPGYRSRYCVVPLNDQQRNRSLDEAKRNPGMTHQTISMVEIVKIQAQQTNALHIQLGYAYWFSSRILGMQTPALRLIKLA